MKELIANLLQLEPRLLLITGGAAVLFYLSTYFVSKTDYEKDENRRSAVLSEFRQDMKEVKEDIKELLKRKY